MRRIRSTAANTAKKNTAEEDDAEKMAALKELSYKYISKDDKAHLKEINGAWNRTCVFSLSIDYLSGKEAIELVAQK